MGEGLGRQPQIVVRIVMPDRAAMRRLLIVALNDLTYRTFVLRTLDIMEFEYYSSRVELQLEQLERELQQEQQERDS